VSEVEVGPAPGAEAAAVLPAQGSKRQLEEQGVADQRAQVQLVAFQGIRVLVEIDVPRGVTTMPAVPTVILQPGVPP
jgi:hypothetical protein